MLPSMSRCTPPTRVRAANRRTVGSIRHPRLVGVVVRVLATAVFRFVAATLLIFVAIEAFRDGGLRSVLMAPRSSPSGSQNRVLVEQFNLDGNLVERYLGWLTNALQGRFGTSHLNDAEVSDLLWQRLPVTLQLMVIATVVALVIGVPVGVAAAQWGHRRVGRPIGTVVAILQAVPVYVTAWVVAWLVLTNLEWRPPSEWVSIGDSLSAYVQQLLMPVAVLVLGEVAVIAAAARIETHRALAAAADDDSRSNGATKFADLVREVMRPRSSGLFLALGRNVGNLLSAVMLVEFVFAVEGLGRELLRAIVSVDLPVVLGVVTWSVMIYIIINAVIELAGPRTAAEPVTNDEAPVEAPAG